MWKTDILEVHEIPFAHMDLVQLTLLYLPEWPVFKTTLLIYNLWACLLTYYSEVS